MSQARYWQPLTDPDAPDGSILCTLCPRHCHIRPGQHGSCYARMNQDGQMALPTYGRYSGCCIDPVEKKPLNQYRPGTAVLSFGAQGCNLKCACCQNWTIALNRSMDRLGGTITPETIATTARDKGCRSVAMTYNEPIISLEYAVEVSVACRTQGLGMIAVSNGYISDDARPEFCTQFDAFNIDLKSLAESFYQKHCHAHLQPVLDTLRYIHHDTPAWLEITTLVIPDHNDSDAEITAIARWIVDNLSPNVPLHLTAFHPDHKMRHVPATRPAALMRARQLAQAQGLHFVYTGNIENRDGDTTFCPTCQKPVIRRDWYALQDYKLDTKGACMHCGTQIPGVYGDRPGTWGRKSQPLRLNVS